MNKILIAVIIVAVTGFAAGQALAADPPAETQQAVGGGYARAIAQVGACLGAGLIIAGGSIGISRIAGRAVEGIARQPEAAGQIFMAWMIPAAMIEGTVLFGVVLCLMVILG